MGSRISRTGAPGCDGKTRYRDHKAATRAIRTIHKHSQRDRIPTRAYECDECGGWHLTRRA